MFINKQFNFPNYIGPMLVAVIIRNISDFSSKLDIHYEEIRILEDVSLNLFLGMAMMTLKLWQLAGIAGNLIILLLAQVLLAALYIYFIYSPHIYSGKPERYGVKGPCISSQFSHLLPMVLISSQESESLGLYDETNYTQQANNTEF